jgi:hypothetical protein
VGRGHALGLLVALHTGCAVGTGIGAGVARSTGAVAGQDLSASVTNYHLDGYLEVAPAEAIAGMTLGSVRTRSRSADLTGAGANNHSGATSLVYAGVGYPFATDRGVRLMPYLLYGRALFDSELLPADVTGQLEVGAEVGVFQLWRIKGLARHGFALRVAFLQLEGNVIDPVLLEKVDAYTGRGMIFVLSWRTSRWRFSL